MSYIEKEAAIKFLRKECFVKYPNTFAFGLGAAAEEIRKMPTADVVEVRHGEYHNTRFTDGVFYQEQCSICGEWTYEYSKNYCSNCGAKMDLERRSENEG